MLLLAAFYVASLATAATNPFPSNVATHSFPGFVLLAAWLFFRPAAIRPESSRRGPIVEAITAAALLAWVASLPNWRGTRRYDLHTPLGVLTYASAGFRNDEQQTLSLLSVDATRAGLVAYHYFAPRWYAYFPGAQRLRFSVLVPFYSPTEHYGEALEAIRRGDIRYAVEDRTIEQNPWDPRLRFGALEDTNGADFYRYVRARGRKVLSNGTFTVWDLAPSDGGFTPQPRQEF
jgi:hypothetical protein